MVPREAGVLYMRPNTLKPRGWMGFCAGISLLAVPAFAAGTGRPADAALSAYEGTYAGVPSAELTEGNCDWELSIHLGNASDIQGLEVPKHQTFAGMPSGLYAYVTGNSSGQDWVMTRDAVSDPALQTGVDYYQGGEGYDIVYACSTFELGNANSLVHRQLVNQAAPTAGPPAGREDLYTTSTFELKGDVLTYTYDEQSQPLSWLSRPRSSHRSCQFRKVSAVPANLRQP